MSMILTRRQFLVAAGAASATIATPNLSWAGDRAEKSLHLYNIHTGEWFKDVYWAEGAYIPESIQALNHLLRDPSNGKIKAMDPALMDLLNTIQHKTQAKKAVEIVSGYRSPEFNGKLRQKSRGVAKHSKHIEGKAVDIRLPGVQLATLRDAARSEQVGGVGYYPRSGFIHVDIRATPCSW